MGAIMLLVLLHALVLKIPNVKLVTLKIYTYLCKQREKYYLCRLYKLEIQRDMGMAYYENRY